MGRRPTPGDCLINSGNFCALFRMLLSTSCRFFFLLGLPLIVSGAKSCWVCSPTLPKVAWSPGFTEFECPMFMVSFILAARLTC